ncbi:MAG: Aminopeptidase YpdF [Candidatus Omnitrophica bacterium]|nr:Aminopeptidase YpdF [Candidatus Omnitrophota bacterium]
MSRERLKSLYASMDREGIDALLVSSWPNVTYVSGFRGDESWALVGPKGEYFITDSRYTEQARKEAKGFKIVERDRRTLSDILKDIVRQKRIKKLGFESHIVTHAFAQALDKTAGSSKVKATRGLIEKLRETKDAGEIRALRKTADIAVKGFHYIRDWAKPGMTERQIQARLEYQTKLLGSEKPAFDMIIASGPRASMPHCQSDGTRTRRNSAVLVDMGTVYGGYHSDLTRSIFFGRMSALFKKVHKIVWDAQRAGIAKAAPGVTCAEVDAACRDHIRKMGYDKYFGHSTGHGVGLEIHEGPTVSARSQTVLQPGMVITVEPGIYLPGRFGVRIEDMVLITEKGNEVLTRDLDKSV